MGASGNFLTAVGRVTSRGARVKEIAASGDAAYNQNAVTGGSLIKIFRLATSTRTARVRAMNLAPPIQRSPRHTCRRHPLSGFRNHIGRRQSSRDANEIVGGLLCCGLFRFLNPALK
jgi:hypothetical protein